MTIEVRQLTIRRKAAKPGERAGERARAGRDGGEPVDEERLRELLQAAIAECRRWVDRRLAEQGER